MSQDTKRNSDSIASKLIVGGVPSNGDTLVFNSVLNIWEFAAGAGGFSSFLGMFVFDALITGWFNAWFTRLTDNPTEVNRIWRSPHAGNLTHYTVEVQANLNTVDGANMRTRTALANANNIVIIDQAVGVFQDITNSDPILAEDGLSMLYTQGDAAITILGCGAEFRS